MPEFNKPRKKQRKLKVKELKVDKKTNSVRYKPSSPSRRKPTKKQLRQQEIYSREALHEVSPTQLAKRRTPPPPKKAGRRKKHSGSKIIYYIFFAIVIVATFSILSVTVLFNAEKMTVEGESKYTDAQIFEASGLVGNENLVRLDTKSAERRVLDKLVYIDNVEIRKSFPSTITFVITGAEPVFNVFYNDKYYVLSKNGRILEISSSPKGNAMVIDGFEPTEGAIEGGFIESADPSQLELLEKIEQTLIDAELDNITEVNISDKLAITMWYDGRIELILGSSQQLKEKLVMAKYLVENEIGKNERVSLLLTNVERVAQRNLTEAPVTEAEPEETEPDDEISSDGTEKISSDAENNGE